MTGFLAQSEAFKAFLAARGIDPAASWHFGFAAAGVGMALGVAVLLAQRERLSHVGGTREGEAGAGGRALRVIGLTAAIMALVVMSDRPGWQWLRWLFLAAPVVAAIVCGFSVDATWRRFGAIAVFFIASMLFWAIFEQAGVSIAVFCDQLTRTEVAGCRSRRRGFSR